MGAVVFVINFEHIELIAETYSEFGQTSKMEFFGENSRQLNPFNSKNPFGLETITKKIKKLEKVKKSKPTYSWHLKWGKVFKNGLKENLQNLTKLTKSTLEYFVPNDVIDSFRDFNEYFDIPMIVSSVINPNRFFSHVLWI